MSWRKCLLPIVLAFVALTACIPYQVVAANVVEVAHSPDVPESGEAVTIIIKFGNAANITNVSLIYCTIKPFKCQAPVYMDQDLQDENKFSYDITKEFEPGTEIGFKFKIYYNDSSTENFPKSTSDSTLHTVTGPFEGFYYFNYTLKSEPVAVDYTLLQIAIIVLLASFIPLVVATVIFMKKKKKKGRNDEEDN